MNGMNMINTIMLFITKILQLLKNGMNMSMIQKAGLYMKFVIQEIKVLLL